MLYFTYIFKYKFFSGIHSNSLIIAHNFSFHKEHDVSVSLPLDIMVKKIPQDVKSPYLPIFQSPK